MAPRVPHPFCEECPRDLEGQEPSFWVLMHSHRPYLLPYYYCDEHQPHLRPGMLLNEQDANLALITHLLSHEH